MATTASQIRKPSTRLRPGRASRKASGRTRSTFATSSSRTTRPTTATTTSSRRRRSARPAIWKKLTDLFRRGAPQGRARCLADSRAPSPRTRRATSTATTKSSSDCRPTRRSSARSCRTAASGWSPPRLKTYGYEPDPHVVEAFTKYRKTHNDGVFDAYTDDVRRCRSSHILTGSARRLRPRPDHRRLPPRRALRRDAAHRAQAAGEGQPRRPPVDRRDHPRSRGAVRTDPGAQRAAENGGELRLRHLRVRRRTRRRPCSGSTSATSRA